MPKGLNSFRQLTMREMMLLMNDMNRLTSSQGFKDSLNLGLTDLIMSANKAALTLGLTLLKSVNPLTGNLNLTAFNNELKRSSMTLTDYSKLLSQLGSVGQESFKSLTKAIISAETPLTAGSKLAQEMGVVIGNTMRWQAASSAIHGVLNTASQAVNYVRSLDSSLNDIRIVTGLSLELMESFARRANEAAKELNSTTNQYAKAALIYYQLGLSDKLVADRTETTLKLANVSGLTAKTVSDQMTAIWNNFYNGSKSLEYYADVITALGATTASSSEEIAKGLSKFSSIALTTGLSYEYATSALSTVVAATRQSADTVGTSFKTLFSRLQGLNLGLTLDDGTTLNKYSKALLTAGVNIKTTSGDLKDMDTILFELSEKWKALGDSEKVALAQTVGGARNYSTFMSLMENWDDFTTNLLTALNALGTLLKLADIYADSWAAASSHVRASAESIYSNLVDDKAFKGMINGFGDVLDMAGKATNAMGGFGGILTLVGAIVARSYGPLLAEGLSNLKYSAMALLPGGQLRVDNIRKEALEDLTSMGNLSPLERTYATNFAQRNQTYLDLQKRNILSQADLSLMLLRMNYVDELELIALLSDKQFRQTNLDFQTAVNITNSLIFRTPLHLSEEETRISNEQTRLRTLLGGLPQPGHGTAETEAIRRTIARELADLQNQDRELSNLRIGYRNLVNAYGGGLPSDFLTLYRQALRGYSLAVFEEGILTRLGNTLNPSNIYNTWDKESVSSALSGIEKLILIGNGQGASLSKMATSGLLTGELINAINAMTTEFKGLQAQGIDMSDTRWETFLNDPRWDSIRQLGLGTGIADDIGREIQERFDNAGLGDIGRLNLAGAKGIGEQEIQRLTNLASAAIANRNLNKAFEDLKSKDLSFGLAGLRAASSVAGIASSALTIANAARVFKDETSTSADKIGATVGALMTLPMGILGLSTGLKDVGTILHLTTDGSKLAGWTGLIGAAAVGAGLYGYSKYQEYKDNNDYGRLMENAQQTTTNLSQYSTIAKETASEFSAVNLQYLSNILLLNEYETGSVEYTLALVDANLSALELKDNYGLSLSDIKVTNGIAMVDLGAVQARQEKLDEIAKESAENSLIASSFLRAAELGSEHYHAITEEALRVAPSSGTGLLSSGKEYVDRWNGEHFYNGSESTALTYKTFMDQISSTVAKDYTVAEIGLFAKLQKEIYELYYGLGTFTLDNLILALNYGGYDSETGKTQYSSDFYKINFLTAKDKNINLAETSYSEGNLFSNNKDIYHILNNIYGQGTITNDADALSLLLLLGEEADNFDLLLQRVNSEATNLFNLVAGFNAPDNVYSSLAASILAQTTNFEDINQATGGTLLSDIKKITDMETALLYLQYRNEIDENATDGYLANLGDLNIAGSLVGHLINNITTDMLNQKIDEISRMPGLTEELLKSYNNLDSLNGDTVSKLLSDISNLVPSMQQRLAIKNFYKDLEDDDTDFIFGDRRYASKQAFELEYSTEIFGKNFSNELIELAKSITEILTTSVLQNLAKTDNQLLTSLYGSINNEDLRSLLGGQEVTDSALLETLARGMSNNDKQTLANYITAFGSQFGSDMAAEVLRGLVLKGTTVHDLGTLESYSNKYIDRNYLNVLNRLDTTNAISTLYSAELLSKLLGQNNEYGKRLNDLVEKGFDSIGGEVGFFKSLWNSGEFSGLFNKLTSDASMVSMINAEVIDKAANKIDILNLALNTDISNLNSAGLASIMLEVAKGTISQGNITESVIDAMSAAGYGDSTRVEALENIAELSDYSDSSISVIEKALANLGKAFTGSFYLNQFWDLPLVEVLEQMPTGIESKYRELLINAQKTGLSSRDFLNTIKSEMPEFYKYITTVGTKKGDISNVLQFWKDIGMFSPTDKGSLYEGETLNNLMMYNPSTGFFGFNPDAIGTTIDLESGTFTQNRELAFLEQALMEKLDSLGEGVLDYMLEKDENGNLRDYSTDGSGVYHLNTNIDTEKQARNLLMAEALLRPEWAGKSQEEIKQQYIDPAILYMRELSGMGAIWDSGEAIEGVKELLEGGKLTSAEAVRAFFYQYGSKILDENGKQMFEPGDKGYEDFLAKYFPDAATTLSSLYQGVFATDKYENGVTQELFKAAAHNGLTFDDWLKGLSDVYNKETGTINYDAAMEAMRQSGWFKDDALMASLLKDYGNTLLEAGENGQKITATIRDMYGRQLLITLGEGKYQTIDDFLKAIENSTNITDAEILANNAANTLADAALISLALLASSIGEQARILSGLSDLGKAIWGQLASALGLGQAFLTALNYSSSTLYLLSSLDKGITNAIKQDYNTGKGNDNLVEYNGVNVSAELLTKVLQALKAIEENTGTTAQLLDALNGLVEEGNEEGVNALTGKKGNVKVDEEGNIYDEEGNLIEFDENGNPVTQGNGGGGGSESSEEPDYYSGGNNPGTDNTSKSAADALQAFIESGGTPAVGDSYTDSSGYTHTYTDTDIQEAYQKVEQEKKGEDTGSNTATVASGQNNNLLPHFAAGTGTIAVTGELGPELHVKPNGDMDLLGKHGREYAWVEPNDKIYTAALTVSILGSKKIRDMISAHASGINNFIPGYFGSIGNSFGTSVGTLGAPSGNGGDGFSGGGGSFGGEGAAEAELTAENHRFDANWLKYRDILERYYTILQLLEDLANELQRFATLADRAWGKERIDNIEKTIDILEQLVVAQRAYLSEINTYLKEDKKTMTEGINEFVDLWKEMYPNRPLSFDGATFDENGVLTNYRLIVETMLDAYNMDVNGYTYASGNYSVGAAGAMGSGLFSLIAGAVALAIGSGGERHKRVTGSFFAAGLNNDDAQEITIESVTTKSLANAQQTVLEEKLKDIQFYTQTLNLYQLQLTVLELMQQLLFDTRLQAILVEVEYKVSLKNNALNLLDYALSKVKDDAYMAAEAVSLIGLEQDINISILEDYEKELKDILNLNLNGEAFFGSDDYTLVPTMETSQLEKDLDTIAKMHEKFWDEETLSYRDHYIENLETGEITFEDPETEEDNDRDIFSKSITDILASVDRGMTSTDEEKNLRHTMDEYNSLIARLYEKYYANYSLYLPDPEEFLQFTNSKERLKYLEQQSMGEENNSSAGGGITLNTRGLLISIGSTAASGEGAVDTPDYLYLIENVDDALDRLNMLSEILNSKTIHADIDKFTSEFKNLDEVSNSLLNIFDGLIEDFPKLGENIQNTNSDLIHFDETTDKWLLDIDSYSEAIEVLDQINKTNRLKLTDEKFELFKEDPMAFWEWMTDMSENFDFTNFTANEIQMLNLLSTTYLSSIANLKDSVLTQIDYLGNSVKTYAKDMDTVFNEFDHYKNLYADWLNIIDLTGRQTTKLSHDLIVELNTNVVDNSINKLKSAKEQVDAMTHMLNLALALYLQAQAELEAFLGDDEQRYWLLNIVDEYKANIDKINKETEEAEDAYMKSWEDALQGLATAFLQTIKDAAAGFEESFSPIYHTFDALSGALERLRNLRDLYLRPYDLAHGLSQIARDIKESILDTDNLNSKRELKKLLDEVNDAQEEGVELSSYDLDIMLKKYDLELARAALEDAKNAKSLVRLARDNNGNWSYVYTANEDDVDEAELRYEDAILAMELTNENYIDSLLDLLLLVLANAEAQITALNPSDFANEEEYFDRVKEIQDLANTQIAFIQEQMENAFANNNYLLDNVSGKAVDIMKDLTTSYDNTLLAMLTGSDSIGSLAALSVDNIGTLVDLAMLAYSDFWIRNAEVWKEAGHDITDASTTVSEAMDTISQDSINNVDEMGKVVGRAVSAFDKLNLVLVINAGKIYDVAANYETLAASINKIIELSGEYIKLNTLTIDTNIHGWEQLDDIYSRLSTDGSVWIKYLDENNEELIKFLNAGTLDTMDWLQNLREFLVNLLKDLELDLYQFSTLAALDDYYNDIDDILKAHGRMNLDIKGELLDAILSTEDEELTGLKNYFDNINKLIDEEGNRLEDGDEFGLLTLDWVNNKELVELILQLLKRFLEVKKEEAQLSKSISKDSGPGWYELNTAVYGVYHKDNPTGWDENNLYGDTGMYTGRWQSMDTSGYSGNWYTGEWPNGSVRRNGRLAWLHLKELVLNAHDTENFLDAMEIVRQLDNLTNWMANGLGVLAPTNVEPDLEILLQEVHITAEFPNATNHFEIEEAFNNLNNLASQYVHRK